MRKADGHKRKGFTLAELLIVAAIIGVLAGVAIPVLNTQLEKAREAVDLAHLRQAKSAGAAYFITNPIQGTQVVRKYYNIRTGELLSWVTPADQVPRCGKGTKVNGLGLWTENGLKYHGNLDVRDCAIMVTGDQDGNVYCGWVKPEYTIKANPFNLFATLYDAEDKKTYLYPTRSAAGSSNAAQSFDNTNYLQMNNDIFKCFNQDRNIEEVDDIYYTLEMYYADILAAIDESGNTIRQNFRLAILTDTYQTKLKKEEATENRPYFFETTKFSNKMCDAEAVTAATQFWARIAEYTGIDMRQFQSADVLSGIVDAITGPTGHS